VIPPLAQTNLQLFRQLEDLGWPEPSVSQAAQGYRLAQRLWSACYRPSGKPFVDHLIGTASALAFADEPPPVVLGGLLHATFDSGDFGPGRGGSSERNRQTLRACIGAEAEELVFEYSAFAWWPGGVSRLSAEPAASPIELRLLAMRIANEWDDWADGGVLRSGKRHMDEYQVTATSQMARLARSHGLDQLASGLEHAVETSLGAEQSNRSFEGMPAGSVLLLPASARARINPRERARRTVRSIPGARPLARAVRGLGRR
jgi:hypothetical protein